MAFDPDYKDDPAWLLGVAKLRAQQIIRLHQLYADGEVGLDGTMEAIVKEARAILDDTASEMA